MFPQHARPGAPPDFAVLQRMPGEILREAPRFPCRSKGHDLPAEFKNIGKIRVILREAAATHPGKLEIAELQIAGGIRSQSAVVESEDDRRPPQFSKQQVVVEVSATSCAEERSSRSPAGPLDEGRRSMGAG